MMASLCITLQHLVSVSSVVYFGFVHVHKQRYNYSNGELLSNIVWLKQTIVSHLSFIG